MGSSTASETTINTSTDSSNTIVTTMTATDGDNTEDSLDLADPLDYLNSENTPETRGQHIQILQPIPITPKTPLTAKQQTPSTAKETEPKFSFELPPVSPKLPVKRDHFSYEQENERFKLREEILGIESLKGDSRRRNSYRAALDDIEKIEVLQDDRNSPKEKRLKRVLYSPKHMKETNGIDSPKKQRQKRTNRRHHSPSRRDKFIYDEKYIAKYREKSRITPTLPDLKIDFFSESAEEKNSLIIPSVGEKRGSVCLNKCIREMGAQLDQTSSINVTTNPLDSGSVHFQHGRKLPQATIVVQQPSLSLDHSNVSTILLKNGTEFVSNVENSQKNTAVIKQKEESMKQLLDVANNLTLEEIHDFEMRYVFVF